MTPIALVAMKQSLSPTLVARCYELAARMGAANPTLDLIIDRAPVEGAAGGHAERQQAMCDVRNRMVERYVDFDYHSHVLWIDADVIEYPADLPTRLCRPNAVVGCANFLQGHGRRWYDIAGYLDHGPQRARMFGQHLSDPNDLLSVGMVYAVPVAVYREAAHEPPSSPIGTEHWSICTAARNLGYQVKCDMSTEIIHAYLPNYGEAIH